MRPDGEDTTVTGTRAGRPEDQTVLITGGAGRIGRYLRDRLRRPGRTLRLFDTRAPDASEMAGLDGVEYVVGSVTDFGAVHAAMSGVDAVVHLAGIASIKAAASDLTHVNITGTAHVFEAARQQGVRRIVFASSNHAAGFGERHMARRCGAAPPGLVLRRHESLRRGARQPLSRPGRHRRRVPADRHLQGPPHRRQVARHLAVTRRHGPPGRGGAQPPGARASSWRGECRTTGGVRGRSTPPEPLVSVLKTTVRRTPTRSPTSRPRSTRSTSPARPVRPTRGDVRERGDRERDGQCLPYGVEDVQGQRRPHSSRRAARGTPGTVADHRQRWRDRLLPDVGRPAPRVRTRRTRPQRPARPGRQSSGTACGT